MLMNVFGRLALMEEGRLRDVNRIVMLSVVLITMPVLACCREAKRPRVSYVSLLQLEQNYGRLITVSNSPTPDQHGTGDRLGLFLDKNGTVWGLPLNITDNGETVGCAPPGLREAKVTDTLPSDMVEVIGAANEPSGWRAGTGKLELLIRDAQGMLRWLPVGGAEIESGPICWSQSPPEQPLKYYRLTKDTSVK